MEHNQLIVEQFTRMATPFAEMPAHSDQTSMKVLIDSAAIGNDDLVLDVCCGPGLVSCAISPRARHVTGIDITPAMIEQATALQRKQGLANLNWVVGDVTTLPFLDDSFSVVLSRYAFHHLLNPGVVLGEMSRVCRRGGRIVLADVFSTTEEQRALYDRIEKLRDPSHVRAMLLHDFHGLFVDAGLTVSRTEFYRLDMGLEPLLAGSHTVPTAADEVRRLLADDVVKDRSGFMPHRVGASMHISFPVAILAGTKA